MKVVVLKDEDAQALLLEMKVSEQELKARFSQQDKEYAVGEVYRRVHYDLVAWLQSHGFVVTR